jgi:hypothetical protein
MWLIDARAYSTTRGSLPAYSTSARMALANSQLGLVSSHSRAPAIIPAEKAHMSKETVETKDMNRELSAEELAAVTGGRQYNVYSNGGFYSGANVHSPWMKHQKKNKKKR